MTHQRERRFYVMSHDGLGSGSWDVRAFTSKREALDALNKAGSDGRVAHYVEAAHIKIRVGPEFKYRWDY